MSISIYRDRKALIPILNERLVIAAQNDDASALMLALRDGADVHYNNDDALQWSDSWKESTWLRCSVTEAAKNGHGNIVYMLLKAGANPSAAHDNDMRPLLMVM